MRPWHVTFASEGRLPLFADEARRRAAVRAIARVAGSNTVLFCVVDNHVHLVLLADGAGLGALARGLTFALRACAGGHVEPARRRPVETNAHLAWLLRYVLTQPTHHHLGASPALWTGSCFQDLVGARALDGLRLRVGEVYPRLQLGTVYGLCGAAPPCRPADDAYVRTAGASRIVAAASAAAAVGPELSGNSATVVQARRAVAAVAREAGIRRAEVGWALRITDRAVARLGDAVAPPALVRAVRLRIALEERVAAGPPSGSTARPRCALEGPSA